MKKAIFSICILIAFINANSQDKVKVTDEKVLKYSITSKKKSISGYEQIAGINYLNPTVSAINKTIDSTEIGMTTYDLQTNKCNPNRLLLHDDGTISAVWNLSRVNWNLSSNISTATNTMTDRGTGYNYFNGTTWGSIPTTRLESSRTGWPNILVCDGKEIVISHGGGGLKIISRTKGNGTWNNFHTIQGSPFFGSGLTWPRAMSIEANGIIGIASTSDYADTTIRLFKSDDGGNTFTFFVPEGLDTTIWAHNEGIGGDGYAMDVRGNVVAFVVGEFEKDVWMFKSIDGGNSFTRKKVFALPIPKWKTDGTGEQYNSDWNKDGVADTLTTTDGYYSVVIDNENNCHVVGGYLRLLKDNTAAANNFNWFVYSPGIWYWKENQKPIFIYPNDGSVLGGSQETWNPIKYMDSSFTIAWIPDLDGNGLINNISSIIDNNCNIYPYTGSTSMSHLAISDNNTIILSFSGFNELGMDTIFNYPYRNIFYRIFKDGIWQSEIIPINLKNSKEQVFPMGANRLKKVENNFEYHLLYSEDEISGLYAYYYPSNCKPISDNKIIYQKISITSTGQKVISDENKITSITNYPNPVSNNSTIEINLSQQADVSIKIMDITGKIIIEIPEKAYNIGIHKIKIDVSQLNKGLYIYNVKADNYSQSNKFIVE